MKVENFKNFKYFKNFQIFKKGEKLKDKKIAIKCKNNIQEMQ